MFRVLCIAGGGAATGGGGGAGGFRDEDDVELVDFKEYEVVVGEGSTNSSGADTYIAKVNSVIETPVFSIGIPNTSDSEVADVSSMLNPAGEVWVEINVSGTQERDGDGTFVSIKGQSMGITWDGTYHFNVTSLLSGESSVTLANQNNSCSATVTFKFSAGYDLFSVGGGLGTNRHSDNGGFTGKMGGSGGGGGPAQSNESGGPGGRDVPGQGFEGGSGINSKGTNPRRDAGGGGGGGAGGAGSNAFNGGADGGDGEFSDITGTNLRYAGGGAGVGSNSNPQPGNGHDKPGGGGTIYGGTTTGQDGIVVFRYTLADVTHSYTGGVITDVDGDRIHTFTSSGILSPFLPPLGAASLVSK